MATPDLEAPRAPWAAGNYVGSQTLLGPIASGDVLESWLARGTGLQGFQQLVVINRISEAAHRSPKRLQAFLEVARAAVQVEHPNVARLYGAGDARGVSYTMEEMLLGESLESILRAADRAQKPMPLKLAVQVIAHAAEGLASIHQKAGKDSKPLELIHGEVTPANVFVTYSGAVKVRNVGIGLLREQPRADYRSPEQALGLEPIDGRSDLFALGTVLYEAVGRCRLFGSALQPESDAPIPSVTTRNPEVPVALDAIILKALARSPESRFASALELQMGLEEWLEEKGGLPNDGAIALYLTSLFGDRIAERTKVVEAARRGEGNAAALARGFGQEPPPTAPKSAPPPVVPAIAPMVPPVVSAPKSRPPTVPAPVLAPPALGATQPTQPLPVAAAAPAAPTARRPGRRFTGLFLLVFLSLAAMGGLFLAGRRLFSSAPGLAGQDPAPSTTPRPVLAKAAPPAAVAPAKPAPAPVPSAPVVAPAPPVPSPMPVATAPAAAVAPVKAPEPPPPPAPKPSRPSGGRLTFDTNPWTSVFIGRRKLGDTPLVEVPLPPGHYTLHLVNAAKGIDQQVEVNLRAGRTTVKSMDL